MKSLRVRFVLVLLAIGCDQEEPADAGARDNRVFIGAECASMTGHGKFWEAVWLAKENKFHSVALMLLAQLRAEPDYDRGCEIGAALCVLTGIDIPSGMSVPEECHHIWAHDRVNYWELWLCSTEGTAFLNGGESNGRSLMNDEQVTAFLEEMIK